MNRTASRCTVTLLAVATAAAATSIGAPAADAQQVLVIDTAAGRVIIDDEWRAIRTFGDMALDRTRAILYARDDEEPEAVMAFSLETGEWIRTIPTPTGDGPRELQQGMAGMTLGSDGRLYVAGYVRVLEFDPLGQYVSNWRPGVETVRGVCEFDGQPAVVAYSGVIRRRPDGTDERFGPGFVDRGRTTVEETPDGLVTRTSRSPPRIACTADAAYVVTDSGEGPDSVFVHHRDGKLESWAVPGELAEAFDDDCKLAVNQSGVSFELPCSVWPRYRRPSLDGRGDLVLLGHDVEVPGAIIDPETGCYAVVRKPERTFAYDALNIYRDSVLVFQNVAWENDQSFNLSTAANRVSLHPLRRVSGAPCPGMLPSVGDG